MTLVLALLMMAPVSPFTFENVQAWKETAGRIERIPALRARLINSGAEDWAEARFRVRVACAEGERSYEVTLQNILPGTQNVESTAFDWIGKIQACDGETSVELIEGKSVPEERRPAYVVLGFPGAALEGILDHRRFDDTRSVTRHVYWNDGGMKLGVYAGVPLYCFRVEPGQFGLVGFLMDRDPASSGPLGRFLRFYDVAPGKASYLGVFELFKGAGHDVGVSISQGQEALDALLEESPKVMSRDVVVVQGYKPRVQGSFTLAK